MSYHGKTSTFIQCSSLFGKKRAKEVNLRLIFLSLLVFASKNSVEKNFTTHHRTMHNEFDCKIDCDAFIIFVPSEKKKVSSTHDNSL